MTKVEMHPDYHWDCPDCGRENFERGVVVEMSDEDAQAFRDELGLEAWEEGNIMQMPSVVACKCCEASRELTRNSDRS